MALQNFMWYGPCVYLGWCNRLFQVCNQMYTDNNRLNTWTPYTGTKNSSAAALKLSSVFLSFIQILKFKYVSLYSLSHIKLNYVFKFYYTSLELMYQLYVWLFIILLSISTVDVFYFLFALFCRFCDMILVISAIRYMVFILDFFNRMNMVKFVEEFGMIIDLRIFITNCLVEVICV